MRQSRLLLETPVDAVSDGERLALRLEETDDREKNRFRILEAIFVFPPVSGLQRNRPRRRSGC